MDTVIYDEFIQTTWIEDTDPLAEFIRAILGVSGEAGEVAEKAKKLLRGDYAKSRNPLEFDPGTQMEFIKELGDTLYYIATVARLLGYDLGHVMLVNKNKLTERALRDKIHGSGDDR